MQDKADAAIESPKQGYDTVEVYETDYTLGANVEKLTVDPLDHNRGHTYIGNAGNNDMTGSNGPDTIDGREGSDKLYGRDGADTLIGGAAADNLGGGGGDDIYDYNKVTDSKPGSRDLILDFDGIGTDGGDRIDLSTIDAVSGGANDTFSFIGTAAFSAPGQVRVSPSGANTLVQANTIGASGAELQIDVSDSGFEPQQWAEGDFIL